MRSSWWRKLASSSLLLSVASIPQDIPLLSWRMLLHLCWQDYSTLAVCEVAWEVAHPGTLVVEHISRYRSSLHASPPHTCGNTDVVQEVLPMGDPGLPSLWYGRLRSRCPWPLQRRFYLSDWRKWIKSAALHETPDFISGRFPAVVLRARLYSTVAHHTWQRLVSTLT
jgi:hypothetical protein